MTGREKRIADFAWSAGASGLTLKEFQDRCAKFDIAGAFDMEADTLAKLLLEEMKYRLIESGRDDGRDR